MEFNKCSQCGAFFSNEGNICPNCATKDTAKILKLENYLETYSIPNTMEELSYSTGISPKDLSRYINENDKFSNLTRILEISFNEIRF